MNMAFTKQQLLATLAELVDEDLKTFQFYLYNNEVEGFERIAKSRAYGLDRELTVDLTVQTYGYKGAVIVTVGILRKMGFNLSADELEEKCKEDTSRQVGKKSENNRNQEGLNSMSKEKCHNTDEGNAKGCNIIYIKHIYTEVHMTEGAWRGFIKEHEVIQQNGKLVATENTSHYASDTFEATLGKEKQIRNVTIQGIPAGETKC